MADPERWRPDPKTLRWAAGQVVASGPHTPDTPQLHCAYDHVRRAADRLREHADMLEAEET